MGPCYFIFCLPWIRFSHLKLPSSRGAQWVSGRVLDSRPRGRRFQYHQPHCVVSLNKTHLLLLSTGSTQEDPSPHSWNIVVWDVKNQNKQTKPPLNPKVLKLVCNIFQIYIGRSTEWQVLITDWKYSHTLHVIWADWIGDCPRSFQLFLRKYATVIPIIILHLFVEIKVLHCCCKLLWFDNKRNLLFYSIIWHDLRSTLLFLFSFLVHCLQNWLIKISKKAKIRNRYNQILHLTQDTTWKSYKKTVKITYNRSKRPALSQQVTIRQWTDKMHHGKHKT